MSRNIFASCNPMFSVVDLHMNIYILYSTLLLAKFLKWAEISLYYVGYRYYTAAIPQMK